MHALIGVWRRNGYNKRARVCWFISVRVCEGRAQKACSVAKIHSPVTKMAMNFFDHYSRCQRQAHTPCLIGISSTCTEMVVIETRASASPMHGVCIIHTSALAPKLGLPGTRHI